MSEKDTKSDNILDFGPRTRDVQRALARVLDHVENAERKDYESNPRSGHIYESVKLLRETLPKFNLSADRPRVHE
jgi:hypothetical protein